MKRLRNLLVITFFLTCLSATGQDRQTEDLSLEEIEAAMKTDERLIVLQFSTDWCVYCKMQERQLNKDNHITHLLYEKTYYSRIDAESKDTIRFNQTLYHPSSYKNGLHELMLDVAGKNEQPLFPMWVIINKENEIVYRQYGVVKLKDLAGVLKTLLLSER